MTQMTKAELMQLLEPLNDDDIIVLPNGNSYRKLAYVEVGRYHAEYGEVGLRELTDGDIEAGYTEDDLMTHPDAVDAIVLY